MFDWFLLKKTVDGINNFFKKPVIGIKFKDQKYPEKAENYVVIKNPSVIKKFLKNPEMGFGEGYTEGDIEIEGDLEKVLEYGLTYYRKFEKKHSPIWKFVKFLSHLSP
jgi:cyclopropane-fatty-acyl-phospholipid synthase